VDFVLGREADRVAWQSAKCYLPKTLFEKSKKGRMKPPKYHNYALFKRMLAVKDVVYRRHKDMFRLYERYCHQVLITQLYWGHSDDSSGDDESVVVAADDTHEADCDDGF